ncbi:carotenoid oxygenase family protein [Actinoplanes sp. M2I2]|uniref:carotenoid oxygenase family protein n=1 Tax=Actinoplanes sp. M2I2 TaxID=1734444 RepID=UPI002021C350|nr:carotenoid oxygenase family protein [Actinoplanes sp. M2I2]
MGRLSAGAHLTDRKGRAIPVPQAHDHTTGFTSLRSEVREPSLRVEGHLPAWLSGSLVRNGPALYEVGSTTMRHWFDGLAMLHLFTIGEGQVSYRNRALHSRAYASAVDAGAIRYREFATDPCRSIFRRTTTMFDLRITDNASVNVVRLGERFLALTDTPMSVEFDPATLETLRVALPDRPPAHLATAHPHHDTADSVLNHGVSIGARSRHRLFRQFADARRPEIVAEVLDQEPRYAHSFSITDNYVVLFLGPLGVRAVDLAAGVVHGRPLVESFRWRPERGSEFLVFSRTGGGLVKRLSAPAAFCFHHVNAYERGSDIVVDLCAYPDAGIIDAFFLDRLRAGDPLPGATLNRYVLDMRPDGATTTTGQPLFGDSFELPRINYDRNNGKPYRYAYGVGNVGVAGRPSGIYDALVKADVEARQARTWHEPGLFPGEPVFVPSPQATAEDDGVLLSLALDTGNQTSHLLVLDAATLTLLARATAPHRIPFDTHGQYYAGLSGDPRS